MTNPYAFQLPRDVKAPCKDCPDRHLACHGSCEKYRVFKEQVTEAKHRSFVEYQLNRMRYVAVKKHKIARENDKKRRLQ